MFPWRVSGEACLDSARCAAPLWSPSCCSPRWRSSSPAAARATSRRRQRRWSGEVPTETTETGSEDLPALALTGDATAGASVFESAGCGACHTLSAAGSSGTVGPNLDDAKPSYELAVTRDHQGAGRHAGLRRSARAAADRGRCAVRRRVDRRLILPLGFPARVSAFAVDLDRTLIAADGELRPRTIDAVTRARGVGHPRDRRHRAHVPVGRAVSRASGDRRPGGLLPGRSRRRSARRDVPAARAAGAGGGAGRDRRARGARPSTERLRRRRAVRGRAHRRTRRPTRAFSTCR